jgi:hypothetical protein
MATDSVWQNGKEVTAVDVQFGGEGYPWVRIATQVGLGAMSGGGYSVERRWGVDGKNRTAYLGKNITSDPQPFTGDMMVAINRYAKTTLQALQNPLEYCRRCGIPEKFNVRVRYGCADLTYISEYETFRMYLDAMVTSTTPSDSLARFMSPAETGSANIHQTLSLDTAYMFESFSVNMVDNTAASIAYAINEVVRDCDVLWAFTDDDTSNGASIMLSTDRGATWTSANIGTLTTSGDNVTGGDVWNKYLLAACVADGVSYASIPDYGVPASGAWVAATASGATWATNFPNTVKGVHDRLAIAVGDGGRIWECTSDTPSNFVEAAGVSATLTTEDLTVMAKAGEDLAYAGGTSAAIVRVKVTKLGRLYSSIVLNDVDGSALSTDAITAIAVPPNRPGWLYVGTDGGEIFVSKNADGTSGTPYFTQVLFPGTGTGSIDSISFDDYGTTMWALHTVSSETTVLRDLSGGAGGRSTEVLAKAADNQLNSIVAFNHCYAVAVGEVNGTNGAIEIATE